MTARQVLIVEDERLIAAEIEHRVRRLGYEVAGNLSSGEEAVQRADEATPHVVLMDIHLRGPMDGIEAAQRIAFKHHIPVIFLTAHSDLATVQRAREVGPFGYILKPFDEKDLMVALEVALQRHALEKRLRESEQKYATTLQSIGDGVIATDGQGHVSFMNPLAEALTGWKFADAAALPVQQILALQDEEGTAVESPALIALRDRAICNLQGNVNLLARDGALIPIDDSAAPILDEHNAVRGAVVVFRDIREKRLQEQALRKAEEQLRQAQKMEAIGRLAGGIAHDVNNMMTVVIGYGDVVLDELPADSLIRPMVQEMKNAGERSAAIIRQLLAFSRKQILMPVEVELNRLVTDLCSMLRRLIGEDIHLDFRPAAEACWVKADPGQIEQVILNLSVNARDAMPDGGRLTLEIHRVDLDEVYVRQCPETRPGPYVQLSVTDTGAGMDPATQERLFEPFFTTKETGKGTGLGLATVYGIVKQSNGHIVVYSEPGRGATFKVYLPRIIDVIVAPASPSAPMLPRGSETILVVEDEEAIRTMMRRLLEEHGYRVITAEHGYDALAKLAGSATPIHLLLTDAIMPGMSGLQLAKAVREKQPHIAVLFMSGYTEDVILRHGILNDQVAFMSKPFTVVEVLAKVRSTLDEQPSSPQSGDAPCV